MSLELLSPGKLNLFLHITGRRENGYHELQTVFQLINLADLLAFDIREDGQVKLYDQCTNIPLKENLIYRAAMQLKESAQTALGADITLLEKNLPMGGGLGGGSSNAAITLLALNKLWNLGWSQEQLMALGLKLGADVPLFIFGKNAWAEGVGEVLKPVNLPFSYFVIVCPPVHVSTQAIFAHPDLARNTPSITEEKFFVSGGHNDCEKITCELYPEVAKALTWLRQFGDAKMTGTGATVFLPCKDEETAKKILENLPFSWQSCVAFGIDEVPF